MVALKAAGVSAAEKSKVRRTTLSLSALDRVAAEFVRKRYGHRTFSDAVRMCLKQQHIRDKAFGVPGRKARGDDRAGVAAPPRKGTPAALAQAEELLAGGLPDREHYNDVAQTVYALVSKGLPRGQASVSHRPGQALRAWLARLWPEDETALESIREWWGLLNLTDAVRFAVRVQASLDGCTEWQPEDE